MMTRIIGVGNYIPSETITNLFFDKHIFLNEEGVLLKDNNASITEKLKKLQALKKEDMPAVHRSLQIWDLKLLRLP